MWISKRETTENIFAGNFYRTVGYNRCLSEASNNKMLMNWIRKMEIGKPFPQEAEFILKSARLAELDAALNMDEYIRPEVEKEEKPSMLAELKKHSDGIVSERSK